MVLKLYGFPQSTCSKRVGVVLLEKQVPFEFHPIDRDANEHKSAGYTSKQPFGQVPYIDDDGFILYESRAISRYIAYKYAAQGTKLIPSASDLKATALLEQACSVEAFNFDPFASGVAMQKIFAVRKGLSTDEKVVEKLLASLDAKLNVYEVILGKQRYLTGEEITLADLFHLPYGALLSVCGSDALSKESRPNVSRWWKELSARASWKALDNGLKSTA